MWNSMKCLSQGHSDDLPHRELNQDFKTCLLLVRCSTKWATPPPKSRWRQCSRYFARNFDCFICYIKNKKAFSQPYESHLELETNLSKILSVDCKFIRCSIPVSCDKTQIPDGDIRNITLVRLFSSSTQVCF